jgi:hypothetical protein
MPRKVRYNFLIDEDVYTIFSKICDKEGLVRGKQVEIFMREFNKRRNGK